MAADVYANSLHEGRGGWTWYTGSAGWMYQFLIGSLLGLKRMDKELHFHPSFPVEWPFINITFQYKNSLYHIKIIQEQDEVKSWHIMDDISLPGNIARLHDDGLAHLLEVHFAVNGNHHSTGSAFDSVSGYIEEERTKCFIVRRMMLAWKLWQHQLDVHEMMVI